MSKITLEISQIKIIISTGARDRIKILPVLPSPFPTMSDRAELILECEAEHGIDYVRENFPGIKTFVFDQQNGKSWQV